MTRPTPPASRIGLLTLPLSDNFGGLLQVVALYAAIAEAGHDPVLIDKTHNRGPAKRAVAWALERIPGQNVGLLRSRARAKRLHSAFLQRMMPARTALVRNARDIEAELSRLRIGTVVVGSDQVWRRDYQGDGGQLNYFLDFGPDDLRRVSYAASFGHAAWPHPELAAPVARLIGRIDALSVRETSGVGICRDTFGRADAVHALDPTLLHDAGFYRALAEPPARAGGTLIYALDHMAEAQRIAAAFGGPGLGGPVSVMSPVSRGLTLPQWLGRIDAADFVITDSYHGTIFSILFGKPFVTLVNATRGRDRFTSLLPALGLGGRMIGTAADLGPTDPRIAPDPADVQARLRPLRQASRDFLHAALAPAGGEGER